MRPTIQAVIFDLDGLLVDSEPVWFRIRLEMCNRFGLTWTDDDQKALMGRSTRAWIDYVTRKMSGHMSSSEVEQTTLEGMVSSYRSGSVRVMPGAREALAHCNERFTVGLASGSPRVLIDAAIDANGWGDYFREVLTSDEVARGKPSPDVYVEAMRRLGVSAAESAVVEDSGSGIQAGKAAGAFVVAVPNEALMPSREALDQADAILVTLAGLPAILDRKGM